MLKKVLKPTVLTTLLLVLISYGALLLLNQLYPLSLARVADTSDIVTDRNGQWLRVYLSDDDKYRILTKQADLPDDYLNLLINYEDRDFYQHHGIDVSAIVRALWQNISSGEVVSGASTLSMQTARLLHPQPRNLRGKIVQAFRAWQLDRQLTKTGILDIYATLAPVGGNREGLAAASYYYLNKPVGKLSLGESAWLVALTQSPERLSKNQIAAIAARDKVLKRAFDNQIIDKARFTQALAEPLAIQQTPFPFDAPHFSAYKRVKKGKDAVKTSLDKPLQQALNQILSAQLPHLHANANLAGGIVDNKTGQWLAYVGSADFFNAARQGQVDMLRAVRSPGSTLKTFITLYAFDWLNYQPQTTIDDSPIIAAYQPNNYDGQFQGRMSLATALSRSRNVPAVRLLQAIEPDYFANSLAELGLTLHFPKGAKPNLSLALGGVGVKADELVKLYRQLANCAYQNKDSIAKPATCKQVTQILQQSQDAQGRVFFGREPVAFKTGTAYGWRDRWIFAYTQDYTIVLWSGRADGQFAEKRASAEQLIPLLRQVVAVLPDPPTSAPRLSLPPIIASRDLPPRLRHVEATTKQTVSSTEKLVKRDPNALAITAPLDNSKIDFNDDLQLSFHVQGGVPPYLYLLNGDIIEQTANKTVSLNKTTAGSYHLMVIDALGESSQSRFSLTKIEGKSAGRRAKW